MTYKTTMTSKGQITIPADVRRSLVLQPGDSVVIDFTKDGNAVIKKNDWKQGLAEIHNMVATRREPRTVDELKQEREQAAQEGATQNYQRVLDQWQ
jgi:AbrB family looped-hinge helix DNA binding protein